MTAPDEAETLEAENADMDRALGQALDEADKGACAIALCNALHEGWDAPDGWDYGPEERDLTINFLVVYAVRDLLDHLLPADDIRLTDSNPYTVKPWPSERQSDGQGRDV